ncbi:uncharacterized protein ASCRUDRAFT_104188 [Ascoidea rubescens DSM 1968]|uniref:Uncharacterized protein n=1 Tax=Ascoidea rubescens DSM 1968 TaxID=1344418 RepID=A0A1D2VRQ4_9ASCO|nr:hypothetical protein ASCRUDRAFT_104188 [Ascoidea rubescens DSM 1968]ODV64293.1 hypothetical protein ASCRUDRAFT_104188 [Ascoidea rubescens DSM 1968]
MVLEVNLKFKLRLSRSSLEVLRRPVVFATGASREEEGRTENGEAEGFSFCLLCFFFFFFFFFCCFLFLFLCCSHVRQHAPPYKPPRTNHRARTANSLILSLAGKLLLLLLLLLELALPALVAHNEAPAAATAPIASLLLPDHYQPSFYLHSPAAILKHTFFCWGSLANHSAPSLSFPIGKHY